MFQTQFLLSYNKMIPLKDEITERAVKTRKQKLYRAMLDEQIRYKHQYPEMESQSPPQHSYDFRQNRSKRFNDTNEKTDKYLRYCQEALKNLRQVSKQRRLREQAPHHIYKYPGKIQSQSSELKQKQTSKVSFLPKSQHFSPPSHQKSKSNRDLSQRTEEKPNLRSYRTIGDKEEIPCSNRNPQRLSKRVRSLKGKSHEISKAKGLFNNKDEGYKQRQQQQELTKSLKRINVGANRSHGKYHDAQKVSQKMYLQRLQTELTQCLYELARYVKAKKEEQQQEKKRKSEQISQGIQAGLAGSKIKDLEDSTKKEAKIHELKLKALINLRRIRDQSRDLATRVDKAALKSPKKTMSSVKSTSRLSQQFELTLMKERLETEDEKHNSQALKIAAKPREDSLPYTQTQTHNHQNSSLIESIAKQLARQQEQNEYLAYCLKELSEFLNNQSQEIRQLGKSRERDQKKQYLGNNCEQTRSRSCQPDRLPAKQNDKGLVRYEEYPKPYQIKRSSQQSQEHPAEEPTREEQTKMRKAFLHRLKKARIRGGFLSQKVQAFKKAPNNQSLGERSGDADGPSE